MSVPHGAPKSATLTSLPPEVQHSIYTNLPPAQIAALAALSTATTPVVRSANLWADISARELRIAPQDPAPDTVRALAHSLTCRWWLLTGLFVPGVPVHRRSGFFQVAAHGGVELPIVHPEKDSCYVFGGRYAAAAIPVVNPSVSLCFFLDQDGPFPVRGMRISLVHTTEAPEEEQDPDLAYLNLGPSATCDQRPEYCHEEDPFAAVTVRLNNNKLLTSFRPKHGNFQVTHIHVPSDLLVTRPRMNHVSVEYDRSSTAAYWLKEVSIMPSILPPPPEEKTATAISIGQPLPQPQPVEPQRVPQPESPPSNRRSNNHSNNHRRPVRRLTDHSFKQHVSEPHPAPRFQNAQHVATKPKHMYHHNYFRSPRRSSPTSPRTRSAR